MQAYDRRRTHAGFYETCGYAVTGWINNALTLCQGIAQPPASFAVLQAETPGSPTGRANPYGSNEAAFLIGIALRHTRMRGRRPDAVPLSVVSRLQTLAGEGNLPCRLALEWLVGTQWKNFVSRPDTKKKEC